MKKVALLLFCLTLLASCSSDDTTPMTKKWNLTNVSGGFAGININFEFGEITWTFNEQNSTLVVEKNTQEPISGISEGTYSYSIEKIGDTSYITINSIESGSIITAENELIINENMSSTGSGADRFVYRLEK